MSCPTDEHSLLCKVYGPAPWAIHELTPQVSDFSFWRDRMGDRRGEVVFGLIDHDGLVVLTRAADYPPGVYRVPSGGILHAETAIDALYREVAEEIGLAPSDFCMLRYAGGVEFRFVGDAGTISFPSYCFLLAPASRKDGDHSRQPPFAGASGDIGDRDKEDEIESCRAVSRHQLDHVLAQLRALEPPWEDWGRYRARSGDVVASAWESESPAREPGSGSGPGPAGDTRTGQGLPGLLDLSLAISPDMACYPGDDPPRRRLTQQRVPDAGGNSAPGWEVSEWSLGSHAGTHVDAPSHLFSGGQTVDQLDLSRLVGPAVVADCRRAAAAGRRVGVPDLPPAGQLAGKIVLLKLGGSADLASGTPRTDCAGLSAAAARHLTAAGVLAVGVDSLSVDPAGGGQEAHAALLGAGVPVIEGLDLRAAFSGAGWYFAGQPLKLAGAEAAPCRAVLWRAGGGDGEGGVRVSAQRDTDQQAISRGECP